MHKAFLNGIVSSLYNARACAIPRVSIFEFLFTRLVKLSSVVKCRCRLLTHVVYQRLKLGTEVTFNASKSNTLNLRS